MNHRQGLWLVGRVLLLTVVVLAAVVAPGLVAVWLHAPVSAAILMFCELCAMIFWVGATS